MTSMDRIGHAVLSQYKQRKRGVIGGLSDEMFMKKPRVSVIKNYGIDEPIDLSLKKNPEDSSEPYTTTTFFPDRTHEFEGKDVIHSYIAGYQFHKMINRWNANIPMRKVVNTSNAIESITYINHPRLEREYEAKKVEFRRTHGQDSEVLMFHGTALASIENILENNFSIDHLPMRMDMNNETRKKTALYGRGVYFSELPAISLLYGDGLLLCKVLSGRCDIYKSTGSECGDIGDEFDSRDVQSRDGVGLVHVIKNTTQILPYCVIKLRKENLPDIYFKPVLIVQSTQQTYRPDDRCPPQTSAITHTAVHPTLTPPTQTLPTQNIIPTAIVSTTQSSLSSSTD